MMRALLLKDFDVLRYGSRVYLVILLLFSLVPVAGFSSFALVYASMLPYQAFAYDERSKWDTMAAMMPYTPRALVASKYALGWLGILAITLVGILSRLIQLAAGRAAALEEIISLAPIVGIALLIMAVTLPLVCRFGVEKGRIIFIAIMVVAAVSLVSGMSVLESVSLSDNLVVILLVCSLVLGIVLQPVSILIAEKLYRRRFYEGTGA